MSADAFAHDPKSGFAAAVSIGLNAAPKVLSPKWLYDPLGAKLFDAITELPEYYPTRTEIALFQSCLRDAVAGIGEGAIVVELGAGSAAKTPLLLTALDKPALYAPIDIAEPALIAGAKAIRETFPYLEVIPIVADFTAPWRLPESAAAFKGRCLGFFPGSTLGNLEPSAATGLLAAARISLGEGAAMLIGIDTPKEQAIILPAYQDALGVTAAFNKNLLVRINRELNGDAVISAFAHEASWNEARSRVEMHLVSLRAQTITCRAGAFTFAEGETIHTESSHKWHPEAFAASAGAAGWRVVGHWMAPQDAFALYRLEA